MAIFPLQKRLRYWQRVLNLPDWDIVAEWSKEPLEMEEGTNEIIEENKQSRIILDKTLRGKVAEIALVHELLHISFEFARGHGIRCDVALEQGIESVAKALVAVEGNYGDS